MEAFEALAREVRERLENGAVVPLLALRLPDFEDVTFRHGSRAARALERRALAALRETPAGTVRAGDALAHPSGSDRYAIALLESARDGAPPAAAEARVALARIASVVSGATGRRAIAGWVALQPAGRRVPIAAAVDAALEAAVRERERRELLATLGHELRAPLSSIRGYLETLTHGGLEEARARRFLDTAHREALRLGRMLDGLLDFSLLDLSVPPASRTADVRRAVEDAVAMLAPAARRRGVTVCVSRSSAVTARIDAAMLGHALRNLIDNAVTWSPSGGHVRIAWRRRGDWVAIAIQDDGPGIAPEDRERIFDFGVRGAAAPEGGSGVGLAIVRALAQRAGGAVLVSRLAAGGARFVLRLPRD